MTKKLSNKIVSLIVVFALMISTIAFLPVIFTARASVVFGELSLENEYEYGSQLIVPSQTVTINGVDRATVSVLEFPDGRATRATVVELNQSGSYKLRYSTTVDNEVYNKEYCFKVIKPSVIYGTQSSAVYGSREMTFQGRNNRFSHTRNGLYVRLGQGETLKFSSLIDMTDCTTHGSVISFTVLPDVLGVADFESIDIRLTDSQNPDIWLNTNVSAADLSLEINAYFLVNGQNQSPSGYAHDLGTMFVGRVGTNQIHPFNGLYYFPNAEWDKNNRYEDFDYHQTVAMFYDSESNAVYNNAKKNDGKKLVADLDDPSHFSEAWEGFPSGKAYLSVTAKDYTSATANFLITRVKDIDLSAELFNETDAPIITVNTDYEDMPEARVGTPYAIPSATAFDDYDGSVPVKTSVWYNYSSPSAVMIEHKNGVFTPNRKGSYSIVYETVDRSGNVAKKALTVRAYESVTPVTLTVSDEKTTAVEAGQAVTLASVVVTGGSGNKKIVTSITSKDGTVIVEDGKFTPQKSGSYSVLYTATDYIGQTASGGYQITVSEAQKPVFNGTPNLPKAFISGSQYLIPAFYADDYTSGELIRRKASVKVTDANGTRTVNENEPYTPKVNANGDEITVTYVCGTATPLEIKIPCILAYEQESGRMRLKVENYLVGEGFTTQKESDYTVITATQENHGWIFANALLAESFRLNIGTVEGKSAFAAIAFTLTDSTDFTQTLTGKIIKKEDGTARLEANGKTYPLSSDFNGGKFEISYSGGVLKVGDTTVKLSGFKGFSSRKVWLDVNVENATIGAQYTVYSVSGHGIKSSATDRTAPIIAILGDYGGTHSYGKKVTLPAAVAGDALDPNVIFTLTVTAPDGTVVKDTSGALLDGVDPTKEYEIETSAYGRYIVSYFAKDYINENEQPFSYAINILDEIAPTLKFKQSFVSEAKIGDTIVIPDIEVSDNVTETEKIIVIRQVVAPDGTVNTFKKNSNAIVATQAGEYVFRIMVVDEAGNIVTQEKSVTVKEA